MYQHILHVDTCSPEKQRDTRGSPAVENTKSGLKTVQMYVVFSHKTFIKHAANEEVNRVEQKNDDGAGQIGVCVCVRD